MSQIIGVIYPIPLQYVNRIFLQNRNIFVKYLPRTSTKLKPNHKAIIYASHGFKEIIGEGIIECIEFLTPDEAWQKHGNKIFLDKKELQEYTISQPTRTSTKKMLVITLRKLKKYKSGIKYLRPITMTGQYLTKEDYKFLIRS